MPSCIHSWSENAVDAATPSGVMKSCIMRGYNVVPRPKSNQKIAIEVKNLRWEESMRENLFFEEVGGVTHGKARRFYPAGLNTASTRGD
jgi:hypothetical protein